MGRKEAFYKEEHYQLPTLEVANPLQIDQIQDLSVTLLER